MGPLKFMSSLKMTEISKNLVCSFPYTIYIELAKKFVEFSCTILWNIQNDLIGQPNITSVKDVKDIF